jgi:RNA polymerase sigma-70 factor (family 1)
LLTDEKKLLALVAGGNEIAFAKLFDFYRNRIYTIALQFTHCNLLAEEIVQEVFLKIWLRRSALNEIQNFKAYLYVMAKNDIYRALKQRAIKHQHIELIADEHFLLHNDTEEKILGKEYSTLLENVVDLLPDKQKMVYKLIKEDGLKREEVASKLNLQPETVKSHLAQAMKKIRSHFQPHIGGLITFIIYHFK